MGEAHGCSFEPTFNRAVKVVEGSDRITSDAGVLLLREADHRLGLIESLALQLHDPRDPSRIRYQVGELLRERLYALCLGYTAQDDLDRLAHDPALKMAVWNRPGDTVIDERLASQPTQSRLIDILAHSPHNVNILRETLGDWVERHVRGCHSDHAVWSGTVDVDSFPIEVHGQQAGAAYNGHYREVAYHPLVASFSVAGDYDSTREGRRLGNGFLHAILRAGNVHTAEGVRRFMEHVIRKARRVARHIDLRLDAGFTFGEVLDYLAVEAVPFVGRLKSNPVLDRMAEPYVRRPPGRPPKGGYEYTVELGPYRAESWAFPQRLILVVIDRPDAKSGQLTLEPDYFFLVTSWREDQRTADELLAHYRRRGTFEDRLGEYQQVVGPHLSSPDFEENEATLLLALLAFNLSSMLRIELEDDLGSSWDLGRFRDYVLKAGARVAKHSHRLKIYLAQAVTYFWNRLAERMQRWRLPSRWSKPRGPKSCAWMPPPDHAHLQVVLRN
jgi:hypothetical protein